MRGHVLRLLLFYQISIFHNDDERTEFDEKKQQQTIRPLISIIYLFINAANEMRKSQLRLSLCHLKLIEMKTKQKIMAPNTFVNMQTKLS